MIKNEVNLRIKRPIREKVHIPSRDAVNTSALESLVSAATDIQLMAFACGARLAMNASSNLSALVVPTTAHTLT